MGKWGKIDFREFKKMADSFQKAIDEGIIEQFIRDFVSEMGYRALRKIVKRMKSDKVWGSGELARAWQVGDISLDGNSYVVEIFNNTEYASFVEYGFRAHWVPGKWEGNTFVYIPGYKPPEGEPGGMQVGPKNGWVEGRFMMSISMKEIERELPKLLKKRQVELLNSILQGKPTWKGE